MRMHSVPVSAHYLNRCGLVPAQLEHGLKQAVVQTVREKALWLHLDCLNAVTPQLGMVVGTGSNPFPPGKDVHCREKGYRLCSGRM